LKIRQRVDGFSRLNPIFYIVNPVPSKGFYSAADDLKPDFQYIILPEGEAWDRSQGVRVSELSTFLKEELKNFAL